MKVLCVCPIGIGNYLLSYPAFYALKKLRPGWKLHLLGLRTNISAWARSDPIWEKVYIFDPTCMKGDIAGAFRVVASLRREHFDTCLNFFPSNKWQYNVLPLLAGIHRRIAFDYHQRKVQSLSLLNTQKCEVDSGAHDYRQNLSLAAAVTGEQVDFEHPVFPKLCDAADEAWAAGYLSANLCDKNRVIALHPGSSAEHGMDMKRWEPQKFAALADRLSKKLDAAVLVLGGPDEKHLKHNVCSAMSASRHIVGESTLRQTAAVLKTCLLAVCNDSGLMHIAAVQNVPTVGIFGPTDERRNGPIGAQTLVVRKEYPGFPVWTAQRVGDRSVPSGIDPQASLHALSVDDAWQQIASWLDAQRIH
ncbi:MAG: hypothetical protein GF398_16795 [Chitinivibrionales bacterium]|nr:hypothetical protein [Chitinivibrionales bacterium]